MPQISKAKLAKYKPAFKKYNIKLAKNSYAFCKFNNLSWPKQLYGEKTRKLAKKMKLATLAIYKNYLTLIAKYGVETKTPGCYNFTIFKAKNGLSERAARPNNLRASVQMLGRQAKKKKNSTKWAHRKGIPGDFEKMAKFVKKETHSKTSVPVIHGVIKEIFERGESANEHSKSDKGNKYQWGYTRVYRDLQKLLEDKKSLPKSADYDLLRLI